MSEGFIKIHRKILASGLWHCHANTLKVFLYLLCDANWHDKPGQLETTLDHIAYRTDLSISSVRRTLRNLSKLEIITHKGTLRGSYKGTQITILKYSDYQFMQSRTESRTESRKQTLEATHHPTNTPLRSTSLRKRQEERREERAQARDTLPEFVSRVKQWQRWERQERKSEIMLTLQEFKLPFRMEEELYAEIMGDKDDGTMDGTPIEVQALRRKREKEAGGNRNRKGSDTDGFRNVADIREILGSSPTMADRGNRPTSEAVELDQRAQARSVLRESGETPGMPMRIQRSGSVSEIRKRNIDPDGILDDLPRPDDGKDMPDSRPRLDNS
jgi:hypothetical protein